MPTNGPFKILSTKQIYNNPWIKVHEDKVIRPDGKDGIFGIVNLIDGVTVLPLDQDNNVYLVEEFKYAVKKYSIEAISGGIDIGETKEQAAKRELMEETGLQAAQWEYLGYTEPFTTVVNCRNHIFIARQITKIQESQEQLTLKLIKISLSEALLWVNNGKITHGSSCIAILKAAKNILNS